MYRREKLYNQFEEKYFKSYKGKEGQVGQEVIRSGAWDLKDYKIILFRNYIYIYICI